MHTNKIWLGFLGAITLVVIWFTWGTVSKLSTYYSLQRNTKVVESEWSILKIDEDIYRVEASFNFIFNDQKYNGYEIFENPEYPNPWAAEQALKQMESKQWYVWFSPKNPHISSLEKYFPFKSALSTAVLWGLWIYFIWLGYYVTQFKR